MYASEKNHIHTRAKKKKRLRLISSVKWIVTKRRNVNSAWPVLTPSISLLSFQRTQQISRDSIWVELRGCLELRAGIDGRREGGGRQGGGQG